MSGLSPPIPAIIEAMSIPPGPPIPPIPPIPPMPPMPPPRPPMFFIISSRSPPPAAPPSPSASLSSSSFHLPKSTFSLFQSKLNAPRSHLVLGRLRVHLFQKVHVKLKSCFFSAPSAPEDQRVLLHLNFWILNVRNVDGEEDNLWPLSP